MIDKRNPPDAPPMRIGEKGDTISKEGIRRNSKGETVKAGTDWESILIVIWIVILAVFVGWFLQP